VRSADGRGPKTTLEHAVPTHFGFDDALAVSRAFHLEELPIARVGELVPVVLALRDEDAVAGSIVERLSEEVVAFARAALHRLELTATDPDVVLGGRVLRTLPPRVVEKIALGVRQLAPDAHVVVAPSEPIVGAALLGLDALAADAATAARARAELDAATSSY
jgi:N-acetylglucosamine kinase-like BadF-type ATPase